MNRMQDMLAADTIERQLEFANLPEGWMALGLFVVFVVLVGSVLFIYRAEQRIGVSGRARLFLAGLRCAVIVLLAVIWLEPTLARFVHRRMEASTLILVDASASMGLQDRYPDSKNAQQVARALEGTSIDDPTQMTRAAIVGARLAKHNHELLRKLAANNPVSLFQFGDRLTPLGRVIPHEQVPILLDTQDQRNLPTSQPTSRPAGREAGAATELVLSADEQATDVGQAVRHAIESQAGSPVAAVVVFSDGRFNRGEPVEVVARYAREKKIPIHVVGVGDLSLPRNISVAAVEAPPSVFVKDPFQITAHLRSQGVPLNDLRDGLLEVQLLERDTDSDRGLLLQSKQVAVRPDGLIDPVVFHHQMTEAAERQLLVRVEPQEAEAIVNDNEKQVTVRALDNKMRVLVVAGTPSWTYRYLTRLFERDATVDLSCWLQSADRDAVRDGNTVIDHFPRDRQELLAYDGILLLDPDPQGFESAWISHVETLVAEEGAGLLYVAGSQNARRFAHDPNVSVLYDLLPVAIDPSEADLIINELGHFQTVAWPPVIAPAVANHAILTLSDSPEDNTRIWSELPGIYWHYPVQRAKPVATVFLRHSNPRMRNSDGGHVLLASQFLGSGRTGYLAYDSMWRWRSLGDQYFNRFWVQLLRHLVEGRRLSGRKRGFIQLERDEYAVGEVVTVEARITRPDRRPMLREQFEATLTVAGRPQPVMTLTAQPGRPGWYRGQFVPTTVGAHKIRIGLSTRDGSGPVSIRSQVRVGQPQLEFRATTLDRESLEVLAHQSAGGRYLSIDEVDQLVALIPSKTTNLILTGQPTSLWDRWWTLALLVGLLGIEWAGRKAAHLL